MQNPHWKKNKLLTPHQKLWKTFCIGTSFPCIKEVGGNRKPSLSGSYSGHSPCYCSELLVCPDWKSRGIWSILDEIWSWTDGCPVFWPWWGCEEDVRSELEKPMVQFSSQSCWNLLKDYQCKMEEKLLVTESFGERPYLCKKNKPWENKLVKHNPSLERACPGPGPATNCPGALAQCLWTSASLPVSVKWEDNNMPLS